MHTWTWNTVGDRAYLTCSLLEQWSHGFFSKTWWPTPPLEITPTLATDAKTYRVKQVHGKAILTPTMVVAYQQGDDTLLTSSAPFPGAWDITEERPEWPPADGLISDGPHQAVWVASADCTPALIGDTATGRVAAVHAGWRGTALQIVPEAVRQFLAQGSQLTDLRVALGPAIAGTVYQVSTTVAAEVGQTVLAHTPPKEKWTEADVTDILRQLQSLPHPPILDDDQAERARLDVRRVNQLQLERLGMTAEQVAIAPHCTFQQPDQFFSYRRTREKQVQWSGIVSPSSILSP
ncbi:MAG: peptidoglycan editing factor PgeF [Leptolyngbyaceae bacterium]|nr:peptidoglycan editing factor PgeF [Leptolyngbyaceae bacterium]